MKLTYAQIQNGYLSVLGRNADIAGLEYFLHQELTQLQFLDILRSSQEYQANLTNQTVSQIEVNQSVIDDAVYSSKVYQINLACVIALDRPTTASEIEQNLKINGNVYNYVRNFANTLEFRVNGKSLSQVLQEKIDLLDLNTQLTQNKTNDVLTDHDYYFNDNFQMVKMLISAYEMPKNLNQQIFSKEVYIAAIIGFDML